MLEKLKNFYIAKGSFNFRKSEEFGRENSYLASKFVITLARKLFFVNMRVFLDWGQKSIITSRYASTTHHFVVLYKIVSTLHQPLIGHKAVQFLWSSSYERYRMEFSSPPTILYLKVDSFDWFRKTMFILVTINHLLLTYSG